MSSNDERKLAKVKVANLLEKDGKLLMVQEGASEVKGKWNVPAGNIEFGESVLEAVKREAKEETGFDVEIISLAEIQSYIEKSGHIALRFNFNCKIVGGNFEGQEGEMIDMKWMSRKELEDLREKGQLRSEKTWWSIEAWFSKKEFSLSVLKSFEGDFK